MLNEEPVDIDALKDKYRPKDNGRGSPYDDGSADNDAGLGPIDDDTKPDSKPTGVVMLEPVREPTPPMEEIKVEPITPTYVEMKRPLKSEYI